MYVCTVCVYVVLHCTIRAGAGAKRFRKKNFHRTKMRKSAKLLGPVNGSYTINFAFRFYPAPAVNFWYSDITSTRGEVIVSARARATLAGMGTGIKESEGGGKDGSRRGRGEGEDQI